MKQNPPQHYWQGALRIGLILFALSWLLSYAIPSFLPDSGYTLSRSGNIAHIYIHGPIYVGDGIGGLARGTVSSTEIVDLIEQADKNPSIKGILVDINSPGGSPVASQEIGNALKDSEKPTVALIRDVGASGGYWVASASDYIIASPMSITGSVGVIGSYLEFSGLLERYNVTYQRMVSGKYKDLGTPLKPLTPVEEVIFQKKLDNIHQYFLDEVRANRNLSTETMQEISTGIIFLGSEAKDLGLVDELGGKKEAIKHFEQLLNITAEPVDYVPEVSFFDLLSGVMSSFGFSIGEGIAGIADEPLIKT